MSEIGVFCLCIASGIVARLAFLPASAVAKRGGALAIFLADFACAVIGGIPFSLVLGYFNYGIAAAYTVLGFDVGLLLPSLVKLIPSRLMKKRKAEKTGKVAEKRL